MVKQFRDKVSESENHNSDVSGDYWVSRTKPEAGSDVVLDMFLKGLSRNAAILDLGAGTGLYTRKMRERGYFDVTPADPFSKAKGVLKLGAEKLVDVFGDNNFDAVFCNVVFPWMSKPAESLHSVSQVLEKGGKFFVTVFRENDEIEKPNGWQPYTLNSFAKFLDDNDIPLKIEEAYRAPAISDPDEPQKKQPHFYRHECDRTPLLIMSCKKTATPEKNLDKNGKLNISEVKISSLSREQVMGM